MASKLPMALRADELSQAIPGTLCLQGLSPSCLFVILYSMTLYIHIYMYIIMTCDMFDSDL